MAETAENGLSRSQPDERALWLVPVLLAVHNAEEAATIQPILEAPRFELPELLGVLLGKSTFPQFLLAVGLVTAAPFVVAVSGDLRRQGGKAVFALLAIQATLLLNVGSHLAGTATLHAPAPGTFTALFINLPFSLWILGRAWRERWLTPRQFAWLPIAALVLHGPVLVGLLWLAGRLTN